MVRFWGQGKTDGNGEPNLFFLVLVAVCINDRDFD